MDWQNEEMQDSIEDIGIDEEQNLMEDSDIEETQELEESEINSSNNLPTLEDIGEAVHRIKLHNEEIRAKAIDTAGKTVENAGRAMQVAGATVEMTGGAVQATGKGMQAAGKATEVAGKGAEAAGAAISQGGQALTEAGTSVSSTGYGAIAGVPLAAVGAVTTAVGKGTEVAGKTAQTAGQAIDTAGKSVDKAGKSIRQSGKQIRQKGKEIKNTGTNIRKNKNIRTNKRQVGVISQQNTKTKTTPGVSLPKSANLEIKFPKKLKVVLIILLALSIFIFLMLYIVLLSGNQTRMVAGAMYNFGQTCTTVTITDTENYVNDGDVSFNDYIAGVVAAESNGSTNLEYLKLLSIIARTYSFGNLSSDCTVSGNSEFQNYVNADDASNKDLIKQAIEETEDLIIVQNENLINIDYCEGCVVNQDSQYYYIRYKSTSMQKIPKNWATKNQLSSTLASLYSSVDKNNTDAETRDCPSNNSDTGISKIGALYLIDNQNYNYEQAIKYYYGNDIEIIVNELKITGTGEFVNPTRYIVCGSTFGSRTHPVTGETDFHTGLDISISGREPIYAAKSGTVSTVVNNVTAINNCDYGYGNYVVIDHGDGTSTLYAHMKYKSIPDSITVGSAIEQGEQIGQVGSTGCSTGNHLHYEVKVDGSNVEPADYLDLTNASGTCKQ